MMEGGFISIDDLYSVFTIQMSKLDEEVMPVDAPMSRDAIITHFENTKFELMKRAKRRLQELAAVNPELARKLEQSKAEGNPDAKTVGHGTDGFGLPGPTPAELEAQRNREEHQRRTGLGRSYAAQQVIPGAGLRPRG